MVANGLKPLITLKAKGSEQLQAQASSLKASPPSTSTLVNSLDKDTTSGKTKTI